MSLLQMSVSGGALILLTAAVRALALHRLPKTAFLVLWEVAALRLLLPFSFRLPFSVPAPAERLPVVGEYLTAAGGSVSPGAAAPAMPSALPASPGAAAHAVLPVVWLAGAVLMAAYFAVCYVRAMERFRASLPDDTPAVQSWLADRRLFRRLEVRRSDRVSSPLTYGILRPVILLPKSMDRGGEAALTCILTHELVHIRRFDAVTKLVFAAALCVHWFNPLVWVMYALANRDLELSCDERVMAALGGGEKAPYALTLITMEETRSRGFSPCNHFSKLAIEERIEAIMKYQKASVLAVVLAAALVLGATTAFAASAPADGAPSPGGQSGTPNTEKIENDRTLTSYVDPDDGRTYYSFDGGKTFEPMTDEEFAQRFPTPKVEWWTYEEYAAWLENEKAELQAMLGEKGWTGGRGEFVWTQEIIDETIAMYEAILQEIKEGALYSKSVDGDADSMLISGGGDIFLREGDGTMTAFDPFRVQVATRVELGQDTFAAFYGSIFTVDKDDALLEDWDTARAPERTEEEWRQIIADIESGKIPPFEIPDDPNVKVLFVNYADGNCLLGV